MINLNITPAQISHEVYQHGNTKKVMIFNMWAMENALGINELNYHDAGVIMLDWAKANNIGIYEEPRENFSIWAAVIIACMSGYDGMIVNDLS